VIRPPPLGYLSLCLAVATAIGCGSSDSPPGDPAVTAGPAICPAGPERPRGTVDTEYARVRESSNAIRRGDGHFWIVESASNTVRRFSPETGEARAAFIDVGNDHNPYDIALAPEADRAYITNYSANSVTVADTTTGEVLAEISDERFDGPSGVAVAGGRVFVTNVAHTGDGFEAGSVALIDRDRREVVATLETRWKNPQFARRIETPEGPRVAISDAGAIDRGEGEGEFARPTSPAGLELWEPGAPGGPPARRTYRLGVDEAEALGAPGRAQPTPDGRFLYFASATAPAVFKFDLAAGEWVRGTDNPIELYEADGDALHHGAMGPNGLLFVTAFNRDALYVLDTSCDKLLAGPVEVGTSGELLEGPHDVVARGTGDGVEAYFVFSLRHTLGRIRLQRRAVSGPPAPLRPPEAGATMSGFDG